MQQAEEIIDEIKQICAQYKVEVPEARRVWPTSIRDRVSALRQLDLSSREIAERTGIPRATVYVMWARKRYRKHNKETKGQFVPIPVNPRREIKRMHLAESNSETNPTAGMISTKQEALTVMLPGGIRVEGLTLESIVELSRRLS